MSELKPYQVGENDIVLAKNEDQAKEILIDYSGLDLSEFNELEVEDLSNRLDMPFQDEEGKKIGTLGSFIEGKKEPEYIVGWE